MLNASLPNVRTQGARKQEAKIESLVERESEADAMSNQPALCVAINDEIKYKADLKTDKRAAASLTYRFTVYDLTLDEFVTCITARENFTAVCRDEEGRFHRAKKYFRRMDVTAVDVDNDGAVYLSFDDALVHPFVQQYAALLYTTASFKPDHHTCGTDY
jgi:hypothetical protein